MKILKKILCICAVMCAVILFGTVDAKADTYGDYEYTVNDDGNTVTITKYNGSATDLTVPYSINGKKVTAIGDYAFYWRSSLVTVKLPSGLLDIQQYAFAICENMSQITLPSGLSFIGDYAFYKCESLTSITLPSSLKSIGGRAFWDCKVLSKLIIPANVSNVGNGIVASCESLKSLSVDSNNKKYDSRGKCNAVIEKSSNTLIAGSNVTAIPSTVKKIGDDAFYECSQLSSVILPNGVTSIGEFAFYNCSNLTSVTIPDTVTEIDDYAFEWCEKLSEITLPDSVLKLGSGVFCNCNITSMHIPANVTDIGNGLFEYCDKLVKVTVDENNKFYDSRNGCNAIIQKKGSVLIAGCSKTVIPDTVKCIGEDAFKACATLTSIVIPASVVKIDDRAFIYCSELENVVMTTGLQEIGLSTFRGCSGLTEIIIPESVVIVRSMAFYSCKNLKKIIFLSGKTHMVGRDVFGTYFIPNAELDLTIYCEKNSNVYNYAVNNDFKYMEFLGLDINTLARKKELTIKGISASAEYTGKLRTFPKISVTVNGKTLTLNKDYTVKYSNNRNVGKAAVIITGKGMYAGTIKKLFNIVLVTGKTYTVNNMKYKVTKVGDNGTGTVALMGTTYSKTAKSFTSLTIGSTATIGGARYKVDAINENAFRNFRYLKKVVIGNNVRMVGSSAFKGCSSLNTLCIGSGVRLIGLQAFASCKNLKSISVSTTYLTSSSVGRNALSGISSKAVIKVPASKLSAYKNLFRLRGVAKTARIIKNKR